MPRQEIGRHTIHELDRLSPSSTRSPQHRDDVQGLRAVAVISVVLAHAGVARLAGGFVGVDLFFVLSGFLITGLLIRELTTAGSISLSRFWARRVRRLLPASTLVLVATAAASAFLMPVDQRTGIATDLLWAAGFSVNWRLAQQQTDYFAQDRLISPVQHYWSLGVEEQFYVVWPLLVLICGGVAARLWRSRTERSIRWTVGVASAAIVLVSFVYSVRLTATDQPYAYFGTASRAWQLGLGALLAAATPLLARVPRPARTVLALLGLAGFAWAVLRLREDGGAAYPGVVALIPTVSAAMLVAAGSAPRGTMVGSALSWRPLARIGDLSYSLYLWHFPVLVIGTTCLEPAGWLVRTALVLLAVACAWVSYTFLEAPLRRLPRLVRHSWLSLAMGGALVALASSTALASTQLIPALPKTIVNDAGARVTLTPTLDEARDFIPAYGDSCMLALAESTPDPCAYGEKGSDRRVALLGDSHSSALLLPLVEAAADRGSRVDYWAKGACTVADVSVYDPLRKRRFDECDDFRRQAIAEVLATGPDVVFLVSAVDPNRLVYDRESGERLTVERSREEIVAGMRRTVERFTDASIEVVVVVDQPRAPADPVVCLIAEKDARECRFARPRAPGPEAAAVEGDPLAYLLRLDEGFCGLRTCSPVAGELLVYRDTNHLTQAYAMTLEPRFARALRDIAARG